MYGIVDTDIELNSMCSDIHLIVCPEVSFISVLYEMYYIKDSESTGTRCIFQKSFTSTMSKYDSSFYADISKLVYHV